MNAIDLEVIYQSTLQIARELTLNMLRTGYSTIIKESQDFTFAVFDGAGRLVAQGIPQPLHIGPLAAQVNEIRRRFRDATEPGDAFIVNHPYQACQNHATDITVISPLFVGERLVGFIGNIAHKPDLGGKVPGTNSGDATDLFQEGLLIPPLKILRRGELNSDVEALICANTRTPEVTWGDVKAQVHTNTYGMSKFGELFAKHGVVTVLACWQRWMELCESELRRAISAVPDGIYGPETDYLDDDGVDVAKPHRISASLEVSGDTLHFILDSDAQARGPINLRPCVSRNFIECLVKMIFIPRLPVNDGLSRPVRVSYPPEGSLLNPRFPAPVNMYVRPSQVTTSVLLRVLARALSGRVPAPGSAAGGSLPFLPQETLRVLKNIRQRYGTRAWSRYGFVNAFNPLKNWYDTDVIGIDTGITMLMAENLRTGFVWETFMKNPEATRGMQRAGFMSYKPTQSQVAPEKPAALVQTSAER